MMDIIVAKRGKGIDELIGSLPPQSPEKEKKSAKDESIFQRLHQQLREMLAEHEKHQGYEALHHYGLGIKEVMAPDEINCFLQSVIIYEDRPYYQFAVGRFASRLLRNAYEAGHTQFHLDTTNLGEPAYLLSRIYAQPYRPLELVVNGNLGNGFAKDSSNIKAIVHGSIGGDSAMLSRESELTIHGEIGGHNFAWGGQHIVVKSNNEKTLWQVCQIALTMPFSEMPVTHVYLIRPDGSEQLVRHYGRIFPWKK